MSEPGRPGGGAAAPSAAPTGAAVLASGLASLWLTEPNVAAAALWILIGWTAMALTCGLLWRRMFGATYVAVNLVTMTGHCVYCGQAVTMLAWPEHRRRRHPNRGHEDPFD